LRTVFRLLRTIAYVIVNPHRSLVWKVVDSLFLVALLFLVLMVLFNLSVDSLGYYFMLIPVVWLITRRSWYSMPRARRQSAAQREDEPLAGLHNLASAGSASSGSASSGEAHTHSWDPIDDDMLGVPEASGMSSHSANGPAELR
jgi:hypothetical protein